MPFKLMKVPINSGFILAALFTITVPILNFKSLCFMKFEFLMKFDMLAQFCEAHTHTPHARTHTCILNLR